MPSYVYLLAHVAEPRFKIGKANDIAARARSIKLSEFDFARSSALRVADDVAAYRLERFLHGALVKWRIAASDIKGGTSGSTEWFHADCRGRLQVFLDANRDLFDFEQIPGEKNLPNIAAAAVELNRVSKAALLRLQKIESARVRKEEWESAFAAEIQEMRFRIQAFIARVSKSGALLGVTATPNTEPALVLVFAGAVEEIAFIEDYGLLGYSCRTRSEKRIANFIAGVLVVNRPGKNQLRFLFTLIPLRAGMPKICPSGDLFELHLPTELAELRAKPRLEDLRIAGVLPVWVVEALVKLDAKPAKNPDEPFAISLS